GVRRTVKRLRGPDDYRAYHPARLRTGRGLLMLYTCPAVRAPGDDAVKGRIVARSKLSGEEPLVRCASGGGNHYGGDHERYVAVRDGSRHCRRDAGEFAAAGDRDEGRGAYRGRHHPGDHRTTHPHVQRRGTDTTRPKSNGYPDRPADSRDSGVSALAR